MRFLVLLGLLAGTADAGAAGTLVEANSIEVLCAARNCTRIQIELEGEGPFSEAALLETRTRRTGRQLRRGRLALRHEARWFVTPVLFTLEREDGVGMHGAHAWEEFVEPRSLTQTDSEARWRWEIHRNWIDLCAGERGADTEEWSLRIFTADEGWTLEKPRRLSR